MCPKHGWSFDLFTDSSDRRSYKLRTWEVQLRPSGNTDGKDAELEIWVQKRERIS